MKKICCLLFLIAILPSLEVFAIDTKNLFQKSYSSVVLIMSFDQNLQPLAIGSGFFIDNGKSIATNYHVIEGATSVKIKLTSGGVEEIKQVRGIDLEHDLAILVSSKNGPPLDLEQNFPDVGDDIIAIGNPQGLEGTLSKGIVSGIREDNGSSYFQITAPISPGSSGGPIINEKGKVIGVSTFYIEGGQNLNFAVPATYINKLLRKSKVESITQKTRKKSKKQKNQIDERVYVTRAVINGVAYDTSFQASIVNKTDYSIKNIRLLAVFYDNSDPLHYMLINVTEVVPPGLAVRFGREDDVFGGHGNYSSSNQNKGAWEAKFRVLDYDIIGTHNSSPPNIPVFK